ncbi:MAG: amino acid adenylation domain-containing protein [Pseudomonadales bacterium]
MPLPRTLRTVFVERCAELPDALAYGFVQSDLSLSDSLTYGELERRVKRRAAGIVSETEAGDRVLLAFDNGLDAVVLFWACIVTGRIPVPAPAPDLRRSGVAARRVSDIAAAAGVTLGVSATPRSEGHAEDYAGVRWRVIDDLDGEGPDWQSAAVPQTAYLQFTSGSTSTPRGVDLTHDNVLAQCAALHARAWVDPAVARGLIWLPWYHDYGLVHGIIQPLFEGVPSFLMGNAFFLRHPLRWLEAIDRYRITHSGAPDFAYLACVYALMRQPDWRGDLSTWAVASCGAEPIRAETLEAFASAFVPHGFRPEALAPAYGLAEAVLTVTAAIGQDRLRTLTADAAALANHQIRGAVDGTRTRRLVSCGEPLPHMEVAIVDPESEQTCPTNRVGEIRVRGPSIAQGYWNDPEQSAAVFVNGWLHTGDLGFLQDGELYVTGRLKDLIIVQGRNLYPQDLEAAAILAGAGQVRVGGAMAFSVDTTYGESAVLLAECSGRPDQAVLDDLDRRLRAATMEQFEVVLTDVRLLKPGTLPRTSSGKLQRSAGRTAYLSHALDAGTIGGRFDADDLTERTGAHNGPLLMEAATAVWQEVLGVDPAPDADFFEQGGDSLLATQLVSRLNAATGRSLTIRDLFERPRFDELAAYLAVAAAGAGTLRPVPAEPPTQPAGAVPELSFSQQRMWFMQAFAPRSTAYHMPLALRLRGPVDTKALGRALAMVAERHAILRTRFESTADGVVPVVDPAAVPAFHESRFPCRSEADFDALRAQLADFGNAPFDLARGPLLRVQLIHVGTDDAVLLLVMHHIIGDQWSFAVLGRELARCYHLALIDATDTSPPPAWQFADYAAWHRRWFVAERHDVELAYWQRRLEGLEPTALNEDYPRPSEQDFHGAQVRAPLPEDLIAALTRLGQAHGASLSMVMIAALTALLFRHTGRDEVGIGVPIANRNHLASEALIGTLVNTLVLRTDLNGAPTFTTLLERVRDAALEAFEHQSLPFELLLRELNLAHDASRSPLFEVLFNMVNTPIGDVTFDGLSWSRFDFDRRASQFDLTVSVDPIFDRAITFEYATRLFEKRTIERLADHYTRLLEASVADPSRPVSDLPMMAETETRQLLAWGTGPEHPPGPGFWARFETAAARHAGSAALVWGARTFTYDELTQRAECLASVLVGRGIRPGDRVGLLLPRGPDMLVALLAVLRSGAAFVPLDPAFPTERLAFMSRDAGLALLLTERGAPDALADTSVPVLHPTEALEPVEGAAATVFPHYCAEAPAYVLYTSGSSGRPKGVAVAHGALDNFLGSMAERPGMGPNDRVLAVTTLSFDIALLELLLPLTVGAQVVLASQEDALDALALARLIEQHQITQMQTTPSRWQMLIDAGWGGSAPLTALCGGEPLPARLANELRGRCRALWNLYGPTETTVWSSCAPIGLPSPTHMPLGTPIHNTRILVLDRHGNLCPAGVPGEICIGGAGVALGYHGNAELTAERFVPDPFGEPGARLYRTGDLGRWRADGTLEHLGRLDQQVKLRGYRIELGEIEAVLQQHPQVSKAVALVRDSTDHGARLLVYAACADPAPTAAELLERLKRALPTYMLPQHVVPLADLPTLPNGKLDRGALPDPDSAMLGDGDGLVAPRNPAERALWELWRELLGTENFGVTDDFFDLGGHSILAVVLVQRIRERLNTDCSLPLLFRHPTIEALCPALEAGHRLYHAELVPLRAHGEQPPLFCLYGVETYQALAAHLSDDRPVYGMMVPSEMRLFDDTDDGSRVELSVEELADEYLVLIRERQPQGPYHLAGFSIGGVLAFEIAQRLRADGERIGLLAMMDCGFPVRGRRGAQKWLARRWRRLRQDGWGYPARVLRTLFHPFAGIVDAEKAQGQDPVERRQIEAIFATRNTIYLRAMRKYRPLPYPGRALYIQAAADPDKEPAYGWGTIMPRLDVREVPGRHMEILREPAVADVATLIMKQLEPPRRGRKGGLRAVPS